MGNGRKRGGELLGQTGSLAAAQQGRPPSADEVLIDILRFVQSADGGDDETIAVRVLDRSLLWAMRGGSIGSLRDRPANEIADIKTRVLASLVAFLRLGSWQAPITTPLSIETLELWNPAEAGPGLVSPPGLQLVFNGPWPTSFWFSVANVMDKASHLLRRCRRCDQMFVRSGRSEYCSKRCSQRARAATNYAKHRERILRERHERYVNAIKKKHPYAKVSHRRQRSTGTDVKKGTGR